MNKIPIFTQYSAFLLLSALCAACVMPHTLTTPVKAAPKAAAAVQEAAQSGVRILIAENKKKILLKNSGTVYIYPISKNKKYKISAPGIIEAKALGGGKIRVGTLQTNQAVLVQPAKNTTLTFETNIYSGAMYLIPDGNQLDMVEHTDLENYLYGVLPYEMSHSWPLEALKAQAVAARTYTLKTIETVSNKNFDVYSDVRSQMYKGGGKRFNSIQQAVDATRGEFLTYQDALFYTFYHGNCGGETDDVTSWNAGAKSIKPLSGARCKYDSHAPNYAWSMNVSRAKIDAYAKSLGIAGKLKKITVTRKTNTGRATQVEIKTSTGKKSVSCGKFRTATGLKSCKITNIAIGGKSVLFKGRGSGHGVGMCQDGANGMAKDGKNYQQILKNYFPGATLTR